MTPIKQLMQDFETVNGSFLEIIASLIFITESEIQKTPEQLKETLREIINDHANEKCLVDARLMLFDLELDTPPLERGGFTLESH